MAKAQTKLTTTRRKKRQVQPTKSRQSRVSSRPVEHGDVVSRRQQLLRIYAVASLGVLFVTSLFWAILGARIQRSNADQLINSSLFQHLAIFRAASFPGAHTMLLKWPLFLFVSLLGASSSVLDIVTVASVLATVAVLAYILHKIDSRPLVFGTLCLALASVLLLVPAQPYPGGILPVNMAMLATRNLEYILYIAALWLLLRRPKLKSWKPWVALILLGLLFASDKLFLTLSIAGAVMAIVVYALARQWPLVRRVSYWLIVGLGAIILASLGLWLINATKLTHIVDQVNTSPYAVVYAAHNVGLGLLYAITGVLTNFGAYPSFGTVVLHNNIPHIVWHDLWNISILTYVLNGLVLLFGLYAAGQLLRKSLRRHANEPDTDGPEILSIMLLFSTVAALAAFVFSNHYYSVDARYLTIALFAIFIALATYLRSKQFADKKVLLVGALLLIGIGMGIPGAVRSYNSSEAALNTTNQRNALVAEVMSHHTGSPLIGDYWRVLPIKSLDNTLNVIPLQGCTSPRGVLSSTAWQVNLHNHSFAYLLTLDGSLTDYPQCSLNQIITAYGRPNTSTLIAGSLSSPKEVILFYDRGVRKSAPKIVLKIPSTVLPIPISELPNTACPSSTTVMNIVAHQDDDLLFMNPDLLTSIQAGDCVRTVYITAGDSGSGPLYWLSREQGSEAAYSEMAGTTDIWVQRIVQLSNQEFVMVANPQGNPKLSLIFMRLPDGNLQGQGFANSHFESLAKLAAGKISTITSVDGQSVYTSSHLAAALATLMQTYSPTLIRTQSPINLSTVYPDHSDHLTVGSYTQRAYQLDPDHDGTPIDYYVGYPVHARPANVTGTALTQKDNAWLAYARFDGAVCQTLQQCNSTPTYGSYLKRQYTTQP